MLTFISFLLFFIIIAGFQIDPHYIVLKDPRLKSLITTYEQRTNNNPMKRPDQLSQRENDQPINIPIPPHNLIDNPSTPPEQEHASPSASFVLGTIEGYNLSQIHAAHEYWVIKLFVLLLVPFSLP